MNEEIVAMATRALDEGNYTHLKTIRDRVDALYDKAPTPAVFALLREDDGLLSQLRRDRAEARRA